MPSTMTSCFPKIKRPQLQAPQSGEDQDGPFPVFIKNFNSLYSSQTTTTRVVQPSSKSMPPLSPEFQFGSSAVHAPATPDLSAVYASQRFFISSPGQSNSIIDSSISSTSSSSLGSDTTIMKNSVAVPTYSPNPYEDFRRSMEEMLEARQLGIGDDNDNNKNGASSWEYLHELLLCYLALNPKTIHKFIIGAFADLVVDHMSTVTQKTTDSRSRHSRKASLDDKSGRLK